MLFVFIFVFIPIISKKLKVFIGDENSRWISGCINWLGLGVFWGSSINFFLFKVLEKCCKNIWTRNGANDRADASKIILHLIHEQIFSLRLAPRSIPQLPVKTRNEKKMIHRLCDFRRNKWKHKSDHPFWKIVHSYVVVSDLGPESRSWPVKHFLKAIDYNVLILFFFFLQTLF